MTTDSKTDKWTTTIQQLFTDGRLTSHQCMVYKKNSRLETNDEKCGCQRPVRHHSFDGTFEGTRPEPEDWNVKEHTKKLQQLMYHSTPSRKVNFSKSFYMHRNRTFSLTSHLVFTVCL